MKKNTGAGTIEKTEVLHGAEETTRGVIHFFTKATAVDACADSLAPSVAMEVAPIRKCYEDLKARNVKVRWITDITEENISYCKALMEYAEVRHLDGIKGNFGVSDSDYIASATVNQGEPISELIYSDAPGIVEQNRYVFNTLWNRAVRADHRIQELENHALRPQTRAVQEPNLILQDTIQMVQRSDNYSVCSVPEGLLYAHSYSLEVFRDVLDRHKKGQHRGIRWITRLDSSDAAAIRIANEFIALGMEIRHVENITPMSFGVSDKETGVTVETLKGGELNTSAIFSSEPVFVNHFAAIFEELWQRGIDAQERIKEIEGRPRQFITIINHPRDIENRYRALVESATAQILLFLPTSTAYRREERIGIFDSLEEAASRGVEIKVLVPSSGDNIKEELHDRMRSKGKFEARKIKTALPTEARTKILVIDRKYYLIVEVRDDSKETFLEAVGSAIFSNSVSTVLSYVTMFDSLWRQSELYEKLEEHDKMQREFINVAAHELRTPTQSILGYAELLLDSGKEDINGGHDAEMLKALARNAYRLQGLITDVLDVARIEGGTLRLDKEEFDLIPLVNNVVDDIRRQISTDGKPIDVSYINSVHTNDSQGASVGGELVVTADKGRILQVLSNVLGNALKFTAKGRILIETMTQSNEAVIVRVTDSGMGIDPEIMPKLFEKFASKSEKGTGLGLYISKNIIEAHGGKMSGYNNTDGIGATFAFTLPLATG